MDAISQTTFWSAFSWMNLLEFRLKFHWSLFLRVQLTISQHWFRWWLGAVQATSHYLKQWWLDYRRIYASLGLNELMLSLRRAHQMTCLGIWSNAFSRSTKRPCTVAAWNFPFNWCTINMASVVLRPGIKPNCMPSMCTCCHRKFSRTFMTCILKQIKENVKVYNQNIEISIVSWNNLLQKNPLGLKWSYISDEGSH